MADPGLGLGFIRTRYEKKKKKKKKIKNKNGLGGLGGNLLHSGVCDVISGIVAGFVTS